MSTISNFDKPVLSGASVSSCISVISWKSILGGTVSALSIALLFNLLGMGLGFALFAPNPHTISTIGAGSAIWFAITGIVSMFIGGWVTSKLTQQDLRFHGALHGLITWGVATLIIALLATTSASTLLTAGAMSVMNKNISLTTQQKNVELNNPNIAQNNVQTNNFSAQNSQTQENLANASHILSALAFTTFILFLLSAIAGVIGGYLGTQTDNFEQHLRSTNSTSEKTRY